MAPSPRKTSNPAYPAETSLADLRRCLVNLPAPLVNVLVDAKILVQNVVIEISWRTADRKDGKSTTRSIYVGWTGMQSKGRSDAVVAQNGRQVRQPELLEIDSAFAKLLGLQDGTRVGILLHSEAPQAQTVSIDPLTLADWEIIEMHPEFLETHFLSQVRALPNPSFKSPSGSSTAHPLTLHLSATSTANVLVTALKPLPPPSSPFVKISGDNAEVIVAPKSRQKSGTTEDDDKSTQSIGGKSGTGTARSKGGRSDSTSRPAVFLRGIDRRLAEDWFDDEQELDKNSGLNAWIDRSILVSKDLSGFAHVWVSIVRPSGFQATVEADAEAFTPATRIAAQLRCWEDAPNRRHIALSSELCEMLQSRDMAGATVRLEPAPPQASKSAVRSLRIYPFKVPGDRHKDGFRFGGKTKADSHEAAQRLLNIYAGDSKNPGLFDGPITDGMTLVPSFPRDEQSAWQGGIVQFHPTQGTSSDATKSARGWLLGLDRRIVVAPLSDAAKSSGSDRRLTIEVMGETAKVSSSAAAWQVGEIVPDDRPRLVGIDPLIEKLTSHLKHSSSTLVTGSHGAGKTSLAYLLAHSLRRQQLAHITYFPCQSLVTEETRVSNIKDMFDRIFGLATWGARFGGYSLVVLDDLDLLCPSESELEVGNDNARSRHVSEVLMAAVRQHCSLHSRVVLLATAQSKEALHNNVIAGHVVKEIVHLTAPDKEMRRKVLEAIVHKETTAQRSTKAHGGGTTDLDFLDLAGRTDGFMPGDLLLLESRARSESLIRALSTSFPSIDLTLSQADFEAALKGFTPTSLRNVTLQHSTTTFASIGGLNATRQTLMETLQYPTLYAPIFAKCPLRLRSGLLLYGYPGCGKTLLASAVAGECGLNFISVKGPEILNKYIGASEKSVRDLFERAQAARPCVLFFDEFDSVAPKRGHDSTGVTDRVVNQLLTQMDGAEGLSGVYVLAATSRPDLIDPALLRPGRLDKSLICNMPDHDDRADILTALSGELKIAESVRPKMQELAGRTDGYTGADLQAVVYNAHLEAIHDVLSDRETNVKLRRSSNPGGADNGAWRSLSSTLDFSHFRLGDDQTKDGSSPAAVAHKASEKARIMQSLLAHRAAQHRARRLRRESLATSRGSEWQDEERSEQAEREPIIEWVHFERALDQTRPSISRDEVKRLGKIYNDFVASRNGEMPSGQGGSEIGGRTSLM